ncbi:uncharacterized protein LOC116228055 [Phasianus colchicus]|uniref:uncharacterized protein LOC116228055 n=1 Tax=Phasianus colchicus TaxID=9054 RepID=UPI00129E3810|nr:uncharacterized protein LOC116228055 [Phasianus colchicus]
MRVEHPSEHTAQKGEICSTTIRFQHGALHTSSCYLKILETVPGPILQSPILVLFIRISFLTPHIPGGFQSAGVERFPWFSHANYGKDYSVFKIWFILASEFHSKSASGELSDLLCTAVVICSNDFCLIFSEGQRAPSFQPRGNGSPTAVRSFPKHTADPAGICNPFCQEAWQSQVSVYSLLFGTCSCALPRSPVLNIDLSSCSGQNPPSLSPSSIEPSWRLLTHCCFSLSDLGAVTEGVPGYVPEQPLHSECVSSHLPGAFCSALCWRLTMCALGWVHASCVFLALKWVPVALWQALKQRSVERAHSELE